MPTLADLYPAYGVQTPQIGLPQGGALGLPAGVLAALMQQRGAQPALASYGAAPAATPSALSGVAPTTDYLSAIRRFEGFAPTASWDVRQHTNGYGTRALYPGETIDRAEAERRLQTEWANAGNYVTELGVPLTPGRQAALQSLTFNAGPSWVNSGLGSAVRAGDWDNARNLFLQYNHAGGQFNQGLADRRAAEAAWFGY